MTIILIVSVWSLSKMLSVSIDEWIIKMLIKRKSRINIERELALTPTVKFSSSSQLQEPLHCLQQIWCNVLKSQNFPSHLKTSEKFSQGDKPVNKCIIILKL